MSKYRIRKTSQFKADFKLALRRGLDVERFTFVVTKLADGESLPECCHDHALQGVLKGFRDCHVTPDCVLIYKIAGQTLILTLAAIGSYSDLF